MCFILFDVEAVFLYPWAVILRELKMFGFWEMLVYIAIVLVGFFYIWKKGVLDWGKLHRPAEGKSNGAHARHHRSGTTQRTSRDRAASGVKFGCRSRARNSIATKSPSR